PQMPQSEHNLSSCCDVDGSFDSLVQPDRYTRYTSEHSLAPEERNVYSSEPLGAFSSLRSDICGWLDATPDGAGGISHRIAINIAPLAERESVQSSAVSLFTSHACPVRRRRGFTDCLPVGAYSRLEG